MVNQLAPFFDDVFVDITAKINKIRRGWNNFAETYANEVEAYNLNFARSLLHASKFEEKSAILDAGCGSGMTTVYILQKLKRVNAKFRTYSVDLSEKMVELTLDRIHQECREYDNIKATVHISSLDDLKMIKSGALDLYHSNLCFHLVPDLTITLHEANRVLKPGGKLCFSTIAQKNENSLLLSLDIVAKELGLPPLHERDLFYLSGRETVQQYLEKNGFKMDLFWYQNIGIYLADFEEYKTTTNTHEFIAYKEQLTEDQIQRLFSYTRQKFERLARNNRAFDFTCAMVVATKL